MLLYKLGEFWGWLTIIFFAGTVANFIMKLMNKKWGKQISASPSGKKAMAVLMKIFVRNHRYFGFGAFLSLLLHFIIQFLRFGISISGIVASAFLVLQVVLGFYASANKKPRRGVWFVVHRSVAVLLIAGIAVHLWIPSVVHTASSLPLNTTSSSSSALREFTPEDLSSYNGQNGQPAYVAYKGIVYDVSNVPQWKGGLHNGETAGTDLTDEISKSPHGDKVFADLPQVGTLRS